MTHAPRARRRLHLGSGIFVIVIALYFIVPLLAMARFALQKVPVATLDWSNAFSNYTLEGLRTAFSEPGFWKAGWLSVQLAATTVGVNLALLVPTAIWAHLRTPKWRPLVEGITLLPWIVPPITLVVGVAATYRAVAPWFLSSPFSLVPFYVIIALPFTYRSLDAGLRAIELQTLTEASRNLGAGWWTTLWRVVMPSIRSALISSSFLTTTVVLGEFTIAALLLKVTFPAFLAEYQRSDPQAAMALALLSMLATSILLLIITIVTRRKHGRIEATRIA